MSLQIIFFIQVKEWIAIFYFPLHLILQHKKIRPATVWCTSNFKSNQFLTFLSYDLFWRQIGLCKNWNLDWVNVDICGIVGAWPVFGIFGSNHHVIASHLHVSSRNSLALFILDIAAIFNKRHDLIFAKLKSNTHFLSRLYIVNNTWVSWVKRTLQDTFSFQHRSHAITC